MKFVDLFAGLGGFRMAMEHIGHECVFASEIDGELRAVYSQNFPNSASKVFGDIRSCRDEVPPHDVLCAGFPCQPFSKSGLQSGLNDEDRGTLFDEIVHVLVARRPEYVFLENVGNFERHDNGRTWEIVRTKLEQLGYQVRGTEHVTTGGSGLLSPLHFGFPHSRERFFIVARQGPLPTNPFPSVDRHRVTTLEDILQPEDQLTALDSTETALSTRQTECINHWNSLMERLSTEEVNLPSFPIWGDEIDATYPFGNHTPFAASTEELLSCLNGHHTETALTRDELLELLPRYARREQAQFPMWKINFIRHNRQWFAQHRKCFSAEWIEALRRFPPSLRKLEWNCKHEERDLWKHVLQFRPSGLRVRRISASPSLVAMTSTQIPIVGPRRRFLTSIEGLRLQGFPDHHKLPAPRVKAFKALGNAVHVGVAEAIARQVLA